MNIKIRFIIISLIISLSCFGQLRLVNKYYTVLYDTTYNIPVYTRYKLTAQMLKGNAIREKEFRSDPRYPGITSELYKNSGYDRGHMTPAADFKFSQEAMTQTFLMTNISPQSPKFNRDTWGKLETYVRNKSLKSDSLIIYTGTNYGAKFISGKINIPKGFWKILWIYKDGKKETEYYYLRNISLPQTIRKISRTQFRKKIKYDIQD